MSVQTFVIVGAGLAGAKAAAELREQGFEGRVVLIGAEPEVPYERPPLSKGYLQGSSSKAEAQPFPAEFYGEREIELLLETTVTALDTGAGAITLGDGSTIPFDRLLLATGSRARPLTTPGAQLGGVHYLRTFADADALKSAVKPGASAVIVGAGWIGMEVAASLRQAGVEITVIEPGRVPYERILGREVGEFYHDVHVGHGVNFRLGEGVEALLGSTAVSGVTTSSGETIEADLVVAGIGAIPATDLAEQAGLAVDNGVLVDETLATTNPNIYAAGDIANQLHPFYGSRIRVEHWANALNQGPAAARAMLGDSSPYELLPYFYSDQYDVGMEYSGYATSWDEVVFRGDRDSGEFIAFWLVAGVVIAGMNVNVWDVNDQVQALIRSRAQIDKGKLQDLDTPLQSLVTS
jgi:3-phenylpropionate/trans-cinnamate dioxygenase ferredoxin reductase component